MYKFFSFYECLSSCASFVFSVFLIFSLFNSSASVLTSCAIQHFSSLPLPPPMCERRLRKFFIPRDCLLLPRFHRATRPLFLQFCSGGHGRARRGKKAGVADLRLVEGKPARGPFQHLRNACQFKGAAHGLYFCRPVI